MNDTLKNCYFIGCKRTDAAPYTLKNIQGDIFKNSCRPHMGFLDHLTPEEIRLMEEYQASSKAYLPKVKVNFVSQVAEPIRREVDIPKDKLSPPSPLQTLMERQDNLRTNMHTLYTKANDEIRQLRDLLEVVDKRARDAEKLSQQLGDELASGASGKEVRERILILEQRVTKSLDVNELYRRSDWLEKRMLELAKHIDWLMAREKSKEGV